MKDKIVEQLNLDKQSQRDKLKEVMRLDEKDGLYSEQLEPEGKLYIEVKCSDELPSKSGKYISREYSLGWGQNTFQKRKKAWNDFNGFRCDVTHWLKKIPAPSPQQPSDSAGEEDVEDTLKKLGLITSPTVSEEVGNIGNIFDANSDNGYMTFAMFKSAIKELNR